MADNHLSTTRDKRDFREHIGGTPKMAWRVRESFPEEMSKCRLGE